MLLEILQREKMMSESNSVDQHMIDLDEDPYIPFHWKIEEHFQGRQFEWDSAKVVLYLSLYQQSRGTIEGNQLREELKGRLVYNANLLDYLLENPQFVPEEWKGKRVHFWGTIYRDGNDNLVVRFLDWHDNRWRPLYRLLDASFNAANPAAISRD